MHGVIITRLIAHLSPPHSSPDHHWHILSARVLKLDKAYQPSQVSSLDL
jgi:hypothetical protein